MTTPPRHLGIETLRRAYANGLSPDDVISEVYRRIRDRGEEGVWIALVPEAEALSRLRHLASDLPLYGIPFAVKDNIDVAGLPTTAGCPDFAYTPEATAPVVERLLAAGAILIGKTNMDQFATGLVGTRSPYGIPTSVYDRRIIAGGSSSGSAVAVAAGLVSFTLGTDTAGSGRVPAAFNGIVGLKPSRGVLDTTGVVPACQSLDCVSVFARTIADTRTILEIAAGGNYRTAKHLLASDPPFRFGVPSASELEFFGNTGYAHLYREACSRLEAIGGTAVEFDFAPFRETAGLLYGGPWVAERYAAVGEFIAAHPESVHPVVREIILAGRDYSALDVFQGLYRLEALMSRAAPTWEQVDLLALPTAGTIYSIAEALADPFALNARLGRYTNFVNLMDLAAIAVPAGLGSDGLPFGLSLVAPAGTDRSLCTLAARFLGEETAGGEGADGRIHLAVVGAHLSGQPLHGQLTERRARLVRRCRTAPGYRFYALADTVPAKPGLVRDVNFTGPGIEVEVWSLDAEGFGTFVALVPPPLAIGTLILEDDTAVKGFVCEPCAIEGAREITDFGGWRAYLATF